MSHSAVESDLGVAIVTQFSEVIVNFPVLENCVFLLSD